MSVIPDFAVDRGLNQAAKSVEDKLKTKSENVVQPAASSKDDLSGKDTNVLNWE